MKVIHSIQNENLHAQSICGLKVSTDVSFLKQNTFYVAGILFEVFRCEGC